MGSPPVILFPLSSRTKRCVLRGICLRSFCASALDCHLFETEKCFSDVTSIGKALGHLDTSVQNTYCKFKIHIPHKMPGVILGKPCQPVNWFTRGIALYESIACHEYNKTKIPGKIPGMTIYDTEDTFVR